MSESQLFGVTYRHEVPARERRENVKSSSTSATSVQHLMTPFFCTITTIRTTSLRRPCTATKFNKSGRYVFVLFGAHTCIEQRHVSYLTDEMLCEFVHT